MYVYEKSMLKDHHLITWLPFIAFIVYMLNEMVIRNGWLSETDILFQKSIHYSNHKENYLRSIQEGIPPIELRLKKKLAFAAISEDFQMKWDEVLHTADMNLVQLLNVELGKVIAKLEKDIDDHLKRDYPESFREKHLQFEKKPWKFTMELEQRHEKKWLKFKNQKLRTATGNNGVKNKTKNDKTFSNCKTDNITRVDVVDNQSERERSVEGKLQRKKSYAGILKTNRNTAGKLEQNRNKGAVDIVANKGCVGVDSKANETHVTSNSVQRRRLKIAKPK